MKAGDKYRIAPTVSDGVGVFVGVDVSVGVGVSDGTGVSVGVGVSGGTGVSVGVFVAVGVSVGIGVFVGVTELSNSTISCGIVVTPPSLERYSAPSLVVGRMRKL